MALSRAYRSCSSTPAPSCPVHARGLYIGYVIVLAKWKPKLMPPLPESERHVELPPFARALAKHGSNALTGLWRGLTGDGVGVAKRTVLAQLFVTLVPALFIAALLGATYRIATAPEVEASTAGLIEAGGLVAAPEQEREQSTGLIGAQSRKKWSRGSRNLRPSRRRRPPPLRQARRRESSADRGGNRREHCRRGGIRSAAGAPLALDHVRRLYRHHRAHLLAVELGAAGSIQDAAHVVLSAGA